MLTVPGMGDYSTLNKKVKVNPLKKFKIIYCFFFFKK